MSQDISVIICTARPRGLIHVLRGLIKQSVEFELVIVDAFAEERRELVQDFWETYCRTQPLIHVPPLPLLPSRTERHCWDIPLYYNTGWVHATGKIVVHLEDFMTPVSEDWVVNHATFVKHHPNFASIGHVTNPEGMPHHRRPLPSELRRDWMSRFSRMRYLLDHPDVLECANSEAYGMWLSGNTGLWLEHVLKSGGAPEWPTHWPESSLARELFNYGLSMWPNDETTAIHFPHAEGGVAGMIMSYDTYGDCVYQPVKMESITQLAPPLLANAAYKRNLIETRKELGKWVP